MLTRERRRYDLSGAHDLLYPEEYEEQHRGYQDYVRGDPVAVLRCHAPGVQEPEERYGQEGQEQGTHGGVDDDQEHRLAEEEQEHGGEADPDQHRPEVDALLGEVLLRPLVRHVAGGPHRVGEEVGRAVPGADDRAGRGGPEADEEEPARDDAEALLYGVGERHEPLLAADALATGEEELGPYDEHRHHEDSGQGVTDDQVQAHHRDPGRRSPAALAHPVVVRGEREGRAHAPDQGEDGEQGSLGKLRWHQPGSQLPEVRGEQYRQAHYGDEHQRDEELHDPLEEPITAGDADQEAEDAVQHRPGPQRKDREHRGERERRGRHRRRPEDKGQDQQVDHEEAADEASEGAPALEDGVAGCHVPASDPLGQVELDERPDNDGPEEDRPVYRPGIQGGDHTPGPHAGRRHDEAWPHDLEPAPEGGRNLGPNLN